jgi:hypothetical protein
VAYIYVLDSINGTSMKRKIYFLNILLFSLVNILFGQTRSIQISDFTSKVALIGVNVYSTKEDKCYNTDLDGRVKINFINKDTFQVENTGYKILQLSYSEMRTMDTIFLQ